MGLEDRQYYRDQNDWGRQWQPGGQRTGGSAISNSIVLTLIAINVAIAILNLFTPVVSVRVLTIDGIMMEGSLVKDGAGQVVLRSQEDPDQLVTIPKNQIVKKENSHWLNHTMTLSTEKPWLFYTFLTYGFAHAPLDGEMGLWHILGNMLVLFFLGRSVEYRLGYWEFLRFYLLAIVLSGIAFVVMRFWSDPSSCIGASGAVSAVLMLFVFMYPKQKVLLFFILPMPAWALGAFVVATDIWTSLKPESVIAYEAHFAGLAFGAAYAYFGWNLRWMRIERLGGLFKGGWFKSRPRLKVHSPGADPKLQVQADQILKKIADQGEASLTPKERRLLNRYSKQIRKHRD